LVGCEQIKIPCSAIYEGNEEAFEVILGKKPGMGLA
jgi:hypothetical protein